MEIIGDDKKLRALYSETRFVDEQVAPGFSATWHRAQSRAKQPRRILNLALASALVLVIFAVATFAIWSKYSPERQTYSAFATTAAAIVPVRPNERNAAATQSVIPGNRVAPPIRSRVNRLEGRPGS